jgi:AcrR family transcriptional regulator
MAATRPLTKGDLTRERLFQAALSRFRDAGYEGASMRTIAADADVTPALLYRYFDSKDALVAELYGRRLAAWGQRAEAIPRGTWATRTAWLTRLALEVLAEDRELLRALAPAMLAGDPLVSPLLNAESVRVSQAAFRRAVEGAKNAPPAVKLEATAELAYLAHLALLLFWTMDRSEGQRATRSVLQYGEQLAPLVELGLRTPIVGRSMLALVRAVTLGLERGSAP